VARLAGGNPEHATEAQLARRLLGEAQVGGMDGVEGTAEDA
jgi:hypothetical protein